MRYVFLLVLLLTEYPLIAQYIKNHRVLKSLSSHIQILSADSLEGRRTGTLGEKKASTYIAATFSAYGISPKGDNDSYFQHYTIPEGYRLAESSRLILNDSLLNPLIDYFPLPFSAPIGQAEDIVSVLLHEPDHVWLIDLADVLLENKDNPHFDLNAKIKSMAQSAQDRNSRSVIFFNSSNLQTNLTFQSKHQAELIIPVLFLQSTASNHIKDINNTIRFVYSLEKKVRYSNNVVSYIDNKMPETIVFGAHFDHLGYGEDGNSMSKESKGQIHNGADDNASGVSALLELSRFIKNHPTRFKHANFLFVAFSGEELGLLGSKHFVDHTTFDTSSIKFMINMDMIGRMNDSTNTVNIGGIGTSPDWSNIFLSLKKQRIKNKFDSSGTGPSDHSSFYRKNIPVLFYFTGLHSDYHKPSDDANLINVRGISDIMSNILRVTEAGQHLPFNFTRTRETSSSTTTRFAVSLGIMPDYSYEDRGVRVDGVSEGKLAQRVGIKPNDIIIRLGNSSVTSVDSYMKALSLYKKGDTTELEILRSKKSILFTVTFQ